MRASFSSWCDEYYNLKMLLIGELFRSKAILERRPFGRRNKLAWRLTNLCHVSTLSMQGILHALIIQLNCCLLTF